MARPFPLTDTHTLLLSAASQRDDGLLDLNARLRGQALTLVPQRLLAAGLVAEAPVGRDEPLWRMDDGSRRMGLRITEAGLMAIGIEHDTTTERSGDATLIRPLTETAIQDVPPGQALRAGSKKSLVLALLCSAEGASLADLVTATGWLPHTTRAALTRFRQAGQVLEKVKGPDGRAIYRISPQPEGETTPRTPSYGL
ncbi:DUF3489 domain-containing protein [Microvirga pudoricolor]|uniref:DUF3489 domain-containing protein n=1 Tax=Microvirga pudoricolor TaxID=2778729 RepID=UPI00195243BB|nr:DUF3489 domain-containing protein [Microvirga pudoricolor]MBM6595334.1 DUF3489 domain-containing protein [Microvirga pudoricolor]